MSNNTLTPEETLEVIARIRILKEFNQAVPAEIHYNIRERGAQAVAEEHGLSQNSKENAENLLKEALNNGITVLTPTHPHWPVNLEYSSIAPLLLWAKGNSNLLTTRKIAVAGSRANTPYGENVTTLLTQELVNQGNTILSGGSYGIDGIAHRTALADGGKTIAFLAGGLDKPYPLGHKDLLDNIADKGLLVSQALPGTAPTRALFLVRNQLIAEIAQAVLITESSMRGGAMLIAKSAINKGTPVGLVPGPITSPTSDGCNNFLKNNPKATPILCWEDAVELANPTT